MMQIALAGGRAARPRTTSPFAEAKEDLPWNWQCRHRWDRWTGCTREPVAIGSEKLGDRGAVCQHDPLCLAGLV